MLKCDCCSKEVVFPYKCSFCGPVFCVEHRTPENHNCTNLPSKRAMLQEAKTERVEAVRPDSEEELPFIEESEKEQKRAEAKQGGKLKYLIPIVCILLILASYASYTYGYNTSYSASYKLGYAQGFASGKSTGYELGYTEGNSSGYSLGYEQGYSLGYQYGNSTGYQYGYGTGNSSGYSLGYTFGYYDGNSTGYEQGYREGNLTGYQYGYVIGNSSGYELGFNYGYLKGVIDGAGTGYNIRDPTYQEMLKFIAWDTTDKNEYSEDYTCVNFAADVKNHAFEAGYKCGFVYIRFQDGAHAIVCFDTTDKGLIFMEPQFDDIVTLRVGRSYSILNGYQKPDYNDTIISFTIIW